MFYCQFKFTYPGIRISNHSQHIQNQIHLTLSGVSHPFLNFRTSLHTISRCPITPTMMNRSGPIYYFLLSYSTLFGKVNAALAHCARIIYTAETDSYLRFKRLLWDRTNYSSGIAAAIDCNTKGVVIFCEDDIRIYNGHTVVVIGHPIWYWVGFAVIKIRVHTHCGRNADSDAGTSISIYIFACFLVTFITGL